jgi:hypothetical protein
MVPNERLGLVGEVGCSSCLFWFGRHFYMSIRLQLPFTRDIQSDIQSVFTIHRLTGGKQVEVDRNVNRETDEQRKKS